MLIKHNTGTDRDAAGDAVTGSVSLTTVDASGSSDSRRSDQADSIMSENIKAFTLSKTVKNEGRVSDLRLGDLVAVQGWRVNLDDHTVVGTVVKIISSGAIVETDSGARLLLSEVDGDVEVTSWHGTTGLRRVLIHGNISHISRDREEVEVGNPEVEVAINLSKTVHESLQVFLPDGDVVGVNSWAPYPNWMEFVHAVNDLAKGRGEDVVFGEPTWLGEDDNGVGLEEYEEAKIGHIRGEKVEITATSKRVADLFKAVAEKKDADTPDAEIMKAAGTGIAGAIKAAMADEDVDEDGMNEYDAALARSIMKNTSGDLGTLEEALDNYETQGLDDQARVTRLLIERVKADQVDEGREILFHTINPPHAPAGTYTAERQVDGYWVNIVKNGDRFIPWKTELTSQTARLSLEGMGGEVISGAPKGPEDEDTDPEEIAPESAAQEPVDASPKKVTPKVQGFGEYGHINSIWKIGGRTFSPFKVGVGRRFEVTIHFAGGDIEEGMLRTVTRTIDAENRREVTKRKIEEILAKVLADERVIEGGWEFDGLRVEESSPVLTEVDLMVCPECEGDGAGDERFDYDKDATVFTCRECCGTGRVRRPFEYENESGS